MALTAHQVKHHLMAYPALEVCFAGLISLPSVDHLCDPSQGIAECWGHRDKVDRWPC